jgi:isoamyl acetate esterase
MSAPASDAADCVEEDIQGSVRTVPLPGRETAAARRIDDDGTSVSVPAITSAAAIASSADREDEEVISISVPATTSPTRSVLSTQPDVVADDQFSPPPVMHGIDEETVADRLSSSFADLSNRVSTIIKAAVPVVTAVQSPYKVIVAFGDSVTERGNSVSSEVYGVGWTAVLADLLRTRADVITRGFSGYNTRYALAALPQAMAGLASSCDVALVWFGANDSVLHGRGNQHVSIEEYGLNLSKIVYEIRNARSTSHIVPVLMTPPPLQQEMAEQASNCPTPSGGSRVNDNTALYARECIEVAKRMHVPCIDVYTTLTRHAGSQERLREYFCDGLHLSGEGNKWVGRFVYNELRVKVPGFADHELPRWFPDWSLLGKLKNPADAFSRI